jgi:DNA-binding MarR family transcriptional regulator
MSKKEKFIEFVEQNLMSKCEELDQDVADYWFALKNKEEKEKTLLSDNGKLILKFMQTTMEKGKAKDIAEAMFISSRSVSGAMRKLVTDGFVEKIGEDPIIYCITEKGRNIEID